MFIFITKYIMFFETFKWKDDQFYFNFKDEKVILKSEGYTTSSARDNGIESVKKNGVNKDRYESDENNFNLKSSNGQVVATSSIFSSPEEVEIAMEKVMTNVANAPVKERD